jgi:hypothetical protein
MRPTTKHYRLAILRIEFAREDADPYPLKGLFYGNRLLRVMEAMR